MLTLMASGTLFSPTALRRALKWTSQSMRWETTISWRFLKSRMSAKMKGPEMEARIKKLLDVQILAPKESVQMMAGSGSK